MKKISLILPLVLLIILLTSFLSLAQPFGAEISSGNPSRSNSSNSPGNATTFAGNVTELSIVGNTITQTWQGYFGNISGGIELTDANSNNLYNWTLVNPQGEVYASTNSTITWGSIQCFNFTANGTQGGIGGETAGATSVGGLNLTQLESRFNIASFDADGVNNTFTLQDHDAFFTANLQFSSNECRSTRVYSSSGAVDQQFEEVLLYEPATRSVVFASLIEQNLAGFDNANHDFEMLVLEDGHNADTSITPYFFFVELD
ncbi:MAG: hypothetical protein AABW89_02490 [Nanoarchaeota archaeon]